MKVWIDPDLCMGAGTCEELAPLTFQPRSDGIWAVKEDVAFFGRLLVFDGGRGDGHGPEGEAGKAEVPPELAEAVIDAAEQCPGECIYLEV